MDLQNRTHINLRGYQFQLADNRSDLNFLWLDIATVHRGDALGKTRVRALNWELEQLAQALEALAAGQRSEWKSRLLDSGLRLFAQRHRERGDAFLVTLVATEMGGPLPAGLQLTWDGDAASGMLGLVKALRLTCTKSALLVFAADLRRDLAAYPIRRLPKDRLHLGQPT